VAGWAYDHANPDCPVLLEVVVNGETVGTVLADRFRADMKRLGRAGGHCGFAWEYPHPLDSKQRHIISVRRAADSAELRGSPALVDRRPSIATALEGIESAWPHLRREIADYLVHQAERLRESAQSRSNSIASPYE
jgi:hypothetical protein